MFRKTGSAIAIATAALALGSLAAGAAIPAQYNAMGGGTASSNNAGPVQFIVNITNMKAWNMPW